MLSYSRWVNYRTSC